MGNERFTKDQIKKVVELREEYDDKGEHVHSFEKIAKIVMGQEKANKSKVALAYKKAIKEYQPKTNLKSHNIIVMAISLIKVNERERKKYKNIEKLAEDIKKRGITYPIVINQDKKLLDGGRRLEAVKSLGKKYIPVIIQTTEDYEAELEVEVGSNVVREDFVFSEKLEIAKKKERIEKAKAEERQKSGKAINDLGENFPGGDVRDIVAKFAGFGSGKQYDKAKYIGENAIPEIIEKLDKGEISIHKAFTDLKEKEKPQEVEPEIKEEVIDEIDPKSIVYEEKEVTEPQEVAVEEEKKSDITIAKDLKELKEILLKIRQNLADRKRYIEEINKKPLEEKSLAEITEEINALKGGIKTVAELENKDLDTFIDEILTKIEVYISQEEEELSKISL